MNISWIEEGKIAAGGMPADLTDAQALQEQGIRAIVTLTEAPLIYHKELAAQILAELEIETLHVPIIDYNPPTISQARQVSAFVQRMNAAGKAVYIHCAAGVGRTGTILHAIYMVSGLSLEEARNLIKGTRPTSQFQRLSPSQQVFSKATRPEFGVVLIIQNSEKH